MSKLQEALKVVLDIFHEQGEVEFSELKERDKQRIFDVLAAASSTRKCNSDREGSYVIFEYDENPETEILFAGSWFEDDGKLRHLHDVQIDNIDSNTTAEAVSQLLEEVSSPLNVVNLTPHEITIVDDNGNIIARFPASGQIARVSTYTSEIDPILGIPVVETKYGKIEGLPKSAKNTIYLVSAVVAQALEYPRRDVYVPDTGPESVVRDAEGKIIGVKRLMRIYHSK
jgi:hypothetical protein